MRILVDGMPRTLGGIGSLIMNIAEYSKTCGDASDYIFEFIVTKGSLYTPMLNKKGYRYYIAPPVHDVKKYSDFITSLFKNNHFDYLWFNNTSKVNIMLPLCAKKHGTKIISHPHGVDIEEKGVKRIAFKIIDYINQEKFYSLIDIPFSCSENAADIYYKGNRELRSRALIIKNSIYTSTFSYSENARSRIRRELNISTEDILLGAVGRLTAVKNYLFLVNVLAGLDKKYKLIIIGEGEERDQLKSQIKEKQLEDRCFLLGMKTNIYDYYSAMDMFLLPSLNEGMPFSIIEAQSEGLPCIISDTLSDELQITDLVSPVSIDSVVKWTKKIECTELTDNRCDYSTVMVNRGYSIEKTYENFTQIIKGNK